MASDFSNEHLEVILVDDHSSDATLEQARSIGDRRLKIINLEKGEGKKSAIALGIASSTGDWIITTDADCEFSPQVLPLLAQQAEQNNYQFIAGAVLIKRAKNWIGRFQEMDLLATMGVTGAGIYLKNAWLANGAHLAYPKATFNEIDGFAGNDQYASGDDMFLLHKIALRYPDQIHFLKNPEAIVYTKAEASLADFFQQRLRWATKGNAFISSSTWWIMVAVFLNSFFIWISFVLLLLDWKLWGPIFILQCLAKWSADAIVLQQLSQFYKKRLSGLGFIVGSIFHGLYITGIGLAAQIKKKYRWKGRVTS